MSHSRGPRGWPSPKTLAQQGGAQGAGRGCSPRGLQWSKVKWRLGARPVRLGCVEGEWDSGREGISQKNRAGETSGGRAL